MNSVLFEAKVPDASWMKLLVRLARLIWLQFVLVNVPSKIVRLELLIALPDDPVTTGSEPSGYIQLNNNVDSAFTPAKDAKRRAKTVNTVWVAFGVFTVLVPFVLLVIS